ncbi:hypothetical protein GQ44DRAFT_791487 [Phaeosphaeriaceae sp. PMI808]|nr:hypothetical protein GQ44DRAFT_791487 [Phaeosphaeriaceae sp. PMI808]
MSAACVGVAAGIIITSLACSSFLETGSGSFELQELVKGGSGFEFLGLLQLGVLVQEVFGVAPYLFDRLNWSYRGLSLLADYNCPARYYSDPILSHIKAAMHLKLLLIVGGYKTRVIGLDSAIVR